MNIQQSLADLQSLKDNQNKDFQKATTNIQADFEKYIRDKSIPLYERWNIFLNAPEELSDELDIYPSMHYDDNGEGLEFFQDEILVNIMDSYHYYCDLKNDYPLNIKEDGKIDLTMVKLYLTDKAKYSDEKLTELIIDGAEDILEKNFCAFTCDT